MIKNQQNKNQDNPEITKIWGSDNVPELRFPEFGNEGEWEISNLGELLIKNSTKNRELKHSLVQSVSNKHGFINQDEYFDNRIIASKDTSNYYVIKKGCFAYNPSRIDVGSLAYKNDDFTSIISPLYVSFTAKQEKIVDLFLLNWFFSEVFKKQMIFEGGVRNTLNYENLEAIKIALPKIEEQQKIASCLSSLDDLIAAETQRIASLRDHKKGLMQNLFPSAGEKVPKVRFKEFEKDGEWVEKKLGEMTIKVGSGVTPLGGESNYRTTGRPFVRSQNVGWGVFLLENIAFIDEPTHQNSKNTEIQFEDVLLNITGASIGRSAVANEFVSGGNVNQHVCIIRPEKDILNASFLNLFLISDFGQKQIDSFQAGGNRQGLNFVQIRSLSIPVPATIQEQQKIASCLSSLDALITAQAEKIEQLKWHKKGLMQGLFPVVKG